MGQRLTNTTRLVVPPASSSAVRAVMKGNRKSDTKPETRLRSRLHADGLRFRKQYPIATTAGVVRVDIAFPHLRLAVFVDGCFWHCCAIHGTQPTTNSGYWQEKLRRNVLRDKRNRETLVATGWRVLRIWEHTDVASAADSVQAEVRRLRSSGGHKNE